MKIRIGIPRSIFYYYYKDIWKYFFDEFNIELVVSPNTNKKMMNDAILKTTDEMCLSIKNYIAHVNYLKDKCDYILIPRVDNYGIDNQTCTNFLALYDIINNLFDIKLLNYNINIENNETEEKGLIDIVTNFGYSKEYAKKAYKKATIKANNIKNKKCVFANEIRVLNKEDKEYLKYLYMIKDGVKLSDKKEYIFDNYNYLLDNDEVLNLMDKNDIINLE